MDDDNNNNNNKMMRKSNNGQMSQLSRVSVAQISESDSEEELVGETVENVDIEVNGLLHDDNDSGGEGDNSVIFVSKEMEIGIAPSARNEGNSEQRNSQRSSERGDHAKIFRERRSVKMPVVTFAVTKINQRGRKQSRFLRLSAVGIENVRQKTDVTSSIYEYTAIVKVVAVSVTKFSIYYENAKHPYTYISPVAIQIVSTITQRVKAVQNKEKMARFNAETFQLNLRHSNSHKEEITALVRNRNKANSILGVSDDEKLVAIVWKALTDPSSEEQNALKKFLDNDQSSVDIPTLAHNIRNFLDGIRYHLLQTRKTEFEALSESLEKSGQNKSAQQVVSRVIEATLENIVMAKFIPKVFAYHEKLCAKNDETFRKCRVLFKDHSQARLHISKEFQSKEGYSVSIANMNDLGNATMPSEILERILDCVKSIYKEASIAADKVLGADEFLPILIYVTLKSNLMKPFAKMSFAWSLCDPEQLQSEGGYYLTVFESGLMWIIQQSEPQNSVN